MSISLGRRPSVRKRRKSTLAASFLVLIIVFVVYYSHEWSRSALSLPKEQSPSVPTHPLLAEHARFWKSFYHVILNNDPHCRKKPDVVIPEKLDVTYETNHEHSRPDVLWMDSADILRLKLAHQNFLNDVLFSDITLVYAKGTRGIATTASDSQMPIVVVQLHMLRLAGSTLPVEVFLSVPTPETDNACANILPSLNATCVYHSSIFTAAGTSVSITPYQHKILAILFSSFDEVLLLDCDVWPTSNPDHLFTYPPFTDSGLVLWPDFWYASESPYFFTIAKIDKPPKLHVKPSIHSGEIMYAKSKHEASILLAAYYNHYGPDYYYPLLSQGAPGQGDKETFGSAALALKEEFYWVKTTVIALGRTDTPGHFIGSAMVQHDPIVDFQHPQQPLLHTQVDESKEHHRAIEEDAVKPAEKPSLTNKTKTKKQGKPLFIHAFNPRSNPQTIFDLLTLTLSTTTTTPSTTDSPLHTRNTTAVRPWGLTPEEEIDWFGYDVEKRLWEVIQSVACDGTSISRQDSSRTKGEHNAVEVCTGISAYVREVFGA